MTDPEVLWRLGRWLAEGGTGRLRLAWSEGDLDLEVHEGDVTSVRGLDPGALGRRLGTAPAGREELLEEAQAIAARTARPEAEALAAAKAELKAALAAWIADAHRRLETGPAGAPPPPGPAISLRHVLVELLLSPGGVALAPRVLPDLDVVLRRAEGFLERYARLRLSQDADLIAAKITGSRSAREIVQRSPHPQGQVVALLAALVLAGLVEPVPVAEVVRPPELPVREPTPPEPPVRRAVRPLWLAGLAVALLGVALLIFLAVRAPASGPDGPTWAIVVDTGCQAIDHERMLRKESRFEGSARIVEPPGGDDPCRQLVWGSFSSRESAEGAIPRLPRGLVSEGFEPHVIPLPGGGDS